MFSKIVLSSNNAGKLREFSALFAGQGIEVLPQSQFAVPDCPEPYGTFVENALALRELQRKMAEFAASAS